MDLWLQRHRLCSLALLLLPQRRKNKNPTKSTWLLQLHINIAPDNILNGLNMFVCKMIHNSNINKSINYNLPSSHYCWWTLPPSIQRLYTYNVSYARLLIYECIFTTHPPLVMRSIVVGLVPHYIFSHNISMCKMIYDNEYRKILYMYHHAHVSILIKPRDHLPHETLYMCNHHKLLQRLLPYCPYSYARPTASIACVQSRCACSQRPTPGGPVPVSPSPTNQSQAPACRRILNPMAETAPRLVKGSQSGPRYGLRPVTPPTGAAESILEHWAHERMNRSTRREVENCNGRRGERKKLQQQ